jgi:hypothetical protein
MRRILSVLFVVLLASAISGVTSSVEARTKLHGAYAFTTARSCTVTNSSPTGTPFGIDPTGMPTLIPTAGVFRQEAADSGVETFNEDGTGISIGRSKTMNTSNTTGSMASAVSGPCGRWSWTKSSGSAKRVTQLCAPGQPRSCRHSHLSFLGGVHYSLVCVSELDGDVLPALVLSRRTSS